MYGMKTYTFEEVKDFLAIDSLQQQVLRLSLVNLVLVAVVGLVLRTLPFLPDVGIVYKNVLHGHSHFAFGGWVMPVLFGLFLRHFPGLSAKVPYHHWRNIAVLMFVSAYGMLLSFPVQGYQAVSITFSTLSLISGFYWIGVLYKPMKEEAGSASISFLRWGLLYFVLSSIGPFATGPLIAMGKQGAPVYFDSIYFYLHFQYNGFFTFLVMALLFRKLEQEKKLRYGKTFFRLMNAAVLPTYALSILWHPHAFVWNFIGGIAAVVQLVALWYLAIELKPVLKTFLTPFYTLAAVAFVLKLVLQVASAFPAIAAMAFENRNFIIAYLHLVLLGFVSAFTFAWLFESARVRQYANSFWLFFLSWLMMEVILVAQAALAVENIEFPLVREALLVVTVFLFAGVFSILSAWRRLNAVQL